ncbi:MAG: DUF4159 domain-containing protein [Methylacidiphilales bacterium]|nr:DUF4159 domain-containing protein [Candidatus Methylacidiphilales bacterium]
MAQLAQMNTKPWTEKLSRSGYFFGAVLLHLIIFVMVATWVIFPAFHPPTEDFTKTYLPPTSPPPPPPPQQTLQVPTHTESTTTQAITAPTATPAFDVPMPDITPQTTPVDVNQKMMTKVVAHTNGISSERLASIAVTEQDWGRSRDNILESNGDPKNVVATFPVYLASYADGDWSCNVNMTPDGKIDTGSLPNLVAKIVEWSHNNIKAAVVPEPLVIGGPDLMTKRPPFIFFTGHKDFVLTDQEVSNLRDYLQVGGMIWGDNALAGRGSRFDVAFRREMKRVVPDLDKDFEPVAMDSPIFIKSWYPIDKIPTGMNYYAEPLEHLDIDGKLAILYTPNDYSDMMDMRLLPGDTTQQLPYSGMPPHTLFTKWDFWAKHDIFYRNFDIPSCLAVQQLGMNIIGYTLVRFDQELLLAP